MEMKFGKTGFARRLLKQNARLISGSEQVASPTEPAVRVVMEQVRHVEIILLSRPDAQPNLRLQSGTLFNSAATFCDSPVFESGRKNWCIDKDSSLGYFALGLDQHLLSLCLERTSHP